APTRAGREVAERLVRARRVRLARPEQVRVRETERADHPHTDLRRRRSVLVAEEEVEGRHFARHQAADGVALLDPAEVLLGAALLLRVTRGSDAEATEAAVGGVALGARARHR